MREIGFVLESGYVPTSGVTRPMHDFDFTTSGPSGINGMEVSRDERRNSFHVSAIRLEHTLLGAWPF
jgi:hypothetical protein